MKSFLRTTRYVSLWGVTAILLAPHAVFAYYAAPVAITAAPTFVTEKSAQLNGQVNPNEMPDATQWFEWGIAGRESTPYETTHNGMWYAGNVLGNTSATIVGLAPNTQYFYRQVAENGRGKDVGVTTYFTTKTLPKTITPLVIVETKGTDTITENSAILRGYVSPHGGNTARWWFEWGTTNKLEYRTNSQWTGANSGPVSVNLNGLVSGTTYFFRMVGENELGSVYGATQVFSTRGTPPAAVTSETPRTQSIQTPSQGGDGVSRVVTTNAQPTSGATFSGSGSNWLPGVSAENRPGDILGALFRKKQSSANATSNSVAGQTEKEKEATSVTGTQVAGVVAGTPVTTFWNALTGKKDVEVVLEKVGPEKVPAHTAVEYRVTYAYRLLDSVSGARLKIVLPEDVVYIGDNTNNELLLEEGSGGERTYVLPVGRLEKGSTRTLSILGMTTGSANGAFPDARVRLEYPDAKGAMVVVSGEGMASSDTSATTASASSVLPSSLLGWALYLALIVGSIIAFRKARAYYIRKKEEISREEKGAGNSAPLAGARPA